MSDGGTQRTPGDPSIRLLVIDDDPETARLLRQWFDGQPYEIHDAPDAARGLELAERLSPALILLDLRMPGMDGLAVARKLKSGAATRATPLILLTACHDVQAKVEAFAAGADDYVTKPFEFEEVDARVRAMLRKRELYQKLETTVADLQSTNAKLEELAVVDDKTGLYNFRQFRRKLREEWLRSERYGAPLSLVMLDLDHFKRVNDSLGHPLGDLVLREFAMLVTGGARATDIAARYGGEEFAVILPHTGADMAARVAERIRAATEQFVFCEGEQPLRITVSAGLATFTPAGAAGEVTVGDLDNPDALVEAADQALYRAKQDGRNRVVVLAEPDGVDRTQETARKRADESQPAV